MATSNLIEYTDKYSKPFGSSWQLYRDKPSLNANGFINNFPGTCPSFKFKQKIADGTDAHGTKDVEIIVLLKHLSNFCRNLEMRSVNCKAKISF